MKIRAIASAFPQTEYDTDTIAAWVGADAEFVANKVGVRRRGFLAADETGLDLAAAAAETVLQKVGLEAESIDLLLYVTQTPEYGIPQNSALLQERCAMRRNLASFDMGLGCSGFPYALATAKGLMAAQNLERALIVTSDPYSKIMDRSDKNTCAVFGDAATATLLDADGTGSIGMCDFGTDGSGFQALIVPAGRGANPLHSIHSDEPRMSADQDKYRLHMNGRAVFNFVLKNIPASIDRTLAINNVSKEDIRKFAVHQGSQFMLEQLAARSGISEDKLLMNLGTRGNTVSSAVPLLVEEYMNSPEFCDGPVLLSGFGVGLSWCSTVVRFEGVS